MEEEEPQAFLSLSMVRAVLEKSRRMSTVWRCSVSDSCTSSCCVSTSSCTDWARASRDRDTEASSSRPARCCWRLWDATRSTRSRLLEPPAGRGSDQELSLEATGGGAEEAEEEG